jgi:hypothetical protein
MANEYAGASFTHGCARRATSARFPDGCQLAWSNSCLDSHAAIL